MKDVVDEHYSFALRVCTVSAFHMVGHLEDELPDMMAVRVTGLVSQIRPFLAEFGTDVRVQLENGWSMD